LPNKAKKGHITFQLKTNSHIWSARTVKLSSF